MATDRILAAHRPKRPLHGVAVRKDVVVHEEALVGIARPAPAVTLQPLDHHLAHRKREGVRADVPDAVQPVVVATKRSPALKRKILVVHGDGIDGDVAFDRRKTHIAEPAGFLVHVLVRLEQVNRLPDVDDVFAEGKILKRFGSRLGLGLRPHDLDAAAALHSAELQIADVFLQWLPELLARWNPTQ